MRGCQVLYNIQQIRQNLRLQGEGSSAFLTLVLLRKEITCSYD